MVRVFSGGNYSRRECRQCRPFVSRNGSRHTPITESTDGREILHALGDRYEPVKTEWNPENMISVVLELAEVVLVIARLCQIFFFSTTFKRSGNISSRMCCGMGVR